jgi:hypothetical protein
MPYLLQLLWKSKVIKLKFELNSELEALLTRQWLDNKKGRLNQIMPVISVKIN